MGRKRGLEFWLNHLNSFVIMKEANYFLSTSSCDIPRVIHREFSTGLRGI